MPKYELNFDMQGSGFTVNETAGENLGNHKLVYRGVDGYWYLADADAAATMPVLGITMGAITSGRKGGVLWLGYIGDGDWTWTGGDEVYASTTAGELTQTPPSGSGDVIQVVAIAVQADIIQFTGNVGGVSGSGGGISGQATVSQGDTYVTVTHGLGGTPNNINVTPLSEVEGRDYWVSNVGAATFRINISMLSLLNDYDFYWRVSY